MKYEYMLHTWGGFYNDEHKAKHGYEEGYLWFDTPEEREAYVVKLKEIEQRLKAWKLVTIFHEGIFTRYKTIATMTFVYNGVEYPYHYDFGFDYPVDSAEYMFTEGSYGCDCNRSSFLRAKGVDIPNMDCGHEIIMKNLQVMSYPEGEGHNAIRN